MELSKIKATRPIFDNSGGPCEVIILGIKVDNDAVILGEFYFGPYALNEHTELYQRLEAFVDRIIEMNRRIG